MNSYMNSGVPRFQMHWQPQNDAPHYDVWQYFAVTNHADAKKGWAKNGICIFCDKSFGIFSTSRAAAHIVGCPNLGQLKEGIHPCIVINKTVADDDRSGVFKNAQKTMG